MNPRTTLILAALAAALGAFVYFYEIGGEVARERVEDAQKRVFPDIDAGDIESIELVTSDDVQAIVERRKGRWRLTAPVEAPGDAVALDGMASTLAQLTSEARIDDPQSREVYGLGDGAPSIVFHVGGVTRRLLIGDAAPVGANTYVADVASDAVFTVATWRMNSFQKTVDQLRDGRVVAFDRAAVEGLSVRWPEASVELEKRGDGWWIVHPIEDEADAGAVDTLLSDLSFLRAEGFIDDGPPDSEVGLDRPSIEVEIATASPVEDRPRDAAEEGAEPIAQPPATILFSVGAELEADSVVVRGSQRSLFRVSRTRIDELPRSLDAFRFKQLSRFPLSEVDAFELRLRDADDSEELVLRGERSDDDEGNWVVAPREMAEGLAATLLSELSRLDASGVAAEAMGAAELAALGLSPARALLRVFGRAEPGEDPPLLADLALGDVDPQRGIAALRSDRETIYWLDVEAGGQIPLGRAAFENRFQAPDAPDPPAAPEAEAPDSADDSPAPESGSDAPELPSGELPAGS